VCEFAQQGRVGMLSHFHRLQEKLIDVRLGVLLFLCVLLGGNSGYDFGLKYVLYIVSIICMAWCLSFKTRKFTALLNFPFILGMFFFSLFVLYIIPIAPKLTANFFFRDTVTNGYALTGFPVPKLPLSLTPETTYISLYDFIPSLSIAALVLLTPRKREIRLAMRALLIAFALSALLGFLQVLLTDNGLYFQPTPMAGTGIPVGFFANPNHLATVIVIMLLFAGLNLIQNITNKNYRSPANVAPILAFIVFSLMMLSLTNCSSAVLILGVTFVPMMLILARTVKHRLTIIGAALLGGGLFVFDYLILGQNLSGIEQQVIGSSGTRLKVWSTVMNYPGFPSFFGTGPGSFYETYLIMSSSSDFTRIYVNEAHNDFLQIVMELGLIGAAIITAYLIWFGRQFFSILTQKINFKNEKVLLLFALLVPLIQSVTDYPLRTPAIMAISVFFTMVIVRFNQLEKAAG